MSESRPGQSKDTLSEPRSGGTDRGETETRVLGGEEPIPTGVWTVTADAEQPDPGPVADTPGQPGTGARWPRADSISGPADRYQYRRALGKGGMGEVRLYRDRVIGRDVAMKMLRGQVAARRADADRRFEREARVQGQLEHPSIVPVYDLGARADGSRYFTMKNVRGQSLRQVLRGLRDGDAALCEQYSLRKLIAAFNSVCLAVDFAHSRGVLHRDLKPGNIMLGDFGEVYVLDWGVAKVQDAPPSDDDPDDAAPAAEGSVAERRAAAGDIAPAAEGSVAERRAAAGEIDDLMTGETRTGELVGTPGYMAPEQLIGKAASDARGDVYALGAMLYEILTLEPMHSGDTLAELCTSVAEDPVTRPSARAPDRHIAPELDEVCLRATARDPALRYQSARELSNAVERFLDGDRDLVLRRDMAEARAREAREALARSRADDADEGEERGRAMRAVTAALGLDPENRDALATLVELVTQPPRELPPGAEEALRASDLRKNRKAARLATMVYLGFAAYIPFPLWMGVRNMTAFLLLAGCIVLCALLSWHFSRRPPADTGAPLSHVVITTLAVVVAATMLGPFTLVPMLAFANTAGYIASTGHKRRWVVIVAGCVAVLAPWLLQVAGLMPATYRLEAGVITILPVMFEYPRLATTVFLLVTNVSIILTGAFFVSRLRDEFAEAERTLQIQAWQLRQIVPEDWRGQVTSPG